MSLPSLPVQREIASILSAYDDLIENNTRRIRILEEMAQSLYREWFVHFRFPGHEKVKLVNSPLGKIPEGWEVTKLSSLVLPQYGYTESANNIKVGPKFVRGTDINKASFIQWNLVPYCPVSEEQHKKYKLKKGDILIIRMADPGKVGIIEKDFDAVFASYLIRINIKSSKLTPYYLFYTLLADRYQGYVTGASTGTTRKSASAGVITDFDILIPDPACRNLFEEQISVIRGLLNSLLEKNANLHRTRVLLLPRLINGDISIHSAARG
ncbi:MAG: restriction endonuclease subunit S [Thermoleophilia bacterium]